MFTHFRKNIETNLYTIQRHSYGGVLLITFKYFREVRTKTSIPESKKVASFLLIKKDSGEGNLL